ADHVTAAHGYQLVGLVLDGALVREAEPVLGGGDLEKRLAGTEAVTTSPAGCRALGSHLAGVLDLAPADLLAQPRRLIEKECLRRFLALLASPHPDRTACEPRNPKPSDEERQAVAADFDAWTATVRDAVAYVRTLPNVDPGRVALVGFSLGGFLALTVA